MRYNLGVIGMWRCYRIELVEVVKKRGHFRLKILLEEEEKGKEANRNGRRRGGSGREDSDVMSLRDDFSRH